MSVMHVYTHGEGGHSLCNALNETSVENQEPADHAEDAPTGEDLPHLETITEEGEEYDTSCTAV